MATAIAIILSTVLGYAISDVLEMATSKKRKLIAKAEAIIQDVATKAGLTYNAAKSRIAREDSKLLTIARDSNRSRNQVLDAARQKIADEDREVEAEYKRSMEKVADLTSKAAAYGADHGFSNSKEKRHLSDAVSAPPLSEKEIPTQSTSEEVPVLNSRFK